MMALVAAVVIILGVTVWMQRRATAFRAQAAAHMQEWFVLYPSLWEGAQKVNRARADYHGDMAKKYDEAAKWPWLPVAPDPPEPSQ